MSQRSTVLAGLLLVAPALSGACDKIQLATNMIWCYQNHDSKATWIVSDAYISGGTNWSGSLKLLKTKDHKGFVEALQRAVKDGKSEDAYNLYGVCQRHNARALEYLQTCGGRAALQSAKHVVSCYDPNTGTNSKMVAEYGKPGRQGMNCERP